MSSTMIFRRSRWARRAASFSLAAAMAAVALVLASTSAFALSQRGHELSASFGTSGEGQLDNPAGVAVNGASGEVYVVDRGHNRLNRYTSSGEFLGTTGWGVANGEKVEQQCEAGEGCLDGIPDSGKGEEGAGSPPKLQAGQLISPEAIAIDNASGPNKGDVYVVADVLPEKSYVYRYNEAGEYLGHATTLKETEEYGRPDGVAVDSSGQLVVEWSGGQIVTLAGGEKHQVLGTIEAELEFAPPRPGFAVDSAGNFLVNFEPGEKFEEEAEGLPYEEGIGVGGFRPCEQSRCFVSKLAGAAGEGEIEPGFPLLSGIESGSVAAIATDPSNGDVYVDDGTEIAALSAEGELVEKFGNLTRGSGVAADASSDTVYVADGGSSKIDVFTLDPPSAPTVDELSVTAIGPNGATLDSLIDPHGATTMAIFEYGTSSCSSGGCTVVTADGAVEGEAFSSGAFGHTSAKAVIGGLTAASTYHYRVIASGKETVTSEEGTFTTQPAAVAFTLPDTRAWEMVSPAKKEGAGFEAISKEGGMIQAAENGDGLTYLATAPDASEPEGNRSPTFTQDLASRVVDPTTGLPEWTSSDIAIPYEHAIGVEPGHEQEYELFSEALTQSVVQPLGTTPQSAPQLSPEEGGKPLEKTIYMRQSSPCPPVPSSCYEPIVSPADDTAEKPEPFGGRNAPQAGIRFITATPDLSHVLFSSEVPLTAQPAAHGKNLYEWTTGAEGKGQLELVNVLPEGTPVEFAGIGALDGESNAPSWLIRHAISNDGSRVFWSAQKHLYMTDMSTGKSIRIDTPEAEAEPGGPEEPVFQTASADGSRVFFTDARRLTKKSTASRKAFETDLYELNVVSGKLTDLSIDVNTAENGETADIRGLVLGASDSGDTVYFVANGVLTKTPNARGESAAPGSCLQTNTGLAPVGATCNLYVEHLNAASEEWQTPELVAELSSEDLPDWINNNENLSYNTVRVSPSGQYLAFMSQQSLTGYDNRDANPAARRARDQEVFLFNSEPPQTLTCASCDPTGARPNGVLDTEASGEGLGLLVDRIETWSGHWLAGSLPGWTGAEGENALYQSRYLSDSGRLFFDSAIPLVPADKNAKEDVYQYEPATVGTCGSEGGCVSLISSGTSDRESAFLDASTSGDDVFFLTASQLVATDKDTNFDVYDARNCSQGPCVTPPGETKLPCATEQECKPAPATQPVFSSPAAAGTTSGNVTTHTKALEAPAKPKPPALTRKQLLAKALKVCRHQRSKHKRAVCERAAKKRYGPKKARKSSTASHRVSTGARR